MAVPRAWRTLWLVAGCALAAGCGAGHAMPASATPTSPATTSSATTPATPAATPARPRPRRSHHRAPPNPGTLPQTMQLPSASTHAFRTEMAALWRAIRSGSVAPGLAAFFPESAYVQVKAIADAQSDWRHRLVGDYALDIAAARALLGAHAATARLVRVDVPPGYAHWVPPGACYNRVGYYEVPNSRLVYREGEAERSFGIASMISWRGVWYVVHLGAVVRQAATGIVDDPSAGPGQPVPSSTC